jgi:hypothetical protein
MCMCMCMHGLCSEQGGSAPRSCCALCPGHAPAVVHVQCHVPCAAHCLHLMRLSLVWVVVCLSRPLRQLLRVWQGGLLGALRPASMPGEVPQVCIWYCMQTGACAATRLPHANQQLSTTAPLPQPTGASSLVVETFVFLHNRGCNSCCAYIIQRATQR